MDKAAVFSQGFVIAGKKSGFDCIFGGRSDKLDTTDEYSNKSRGCRMDREGQDRIDEWAWCDVEEAAAFPKRPATPGFQHRVSLVAVQALRDKGVFKVRVKRIKRATSRRRVHYGAAVE